MFMKSNPQVHLTSRNIFKRLWSKQYFSSMYQHQAVIAMGSNMGDSTKVMTEAIIQLQSLGVGYVESTSFLYESKPMYFSDQPSFLNAACLFKTQLLPTELLDKLKELERSIGRQESFRNGPRIIDLDIIFYNNETFKSANPSASSSSSSSISSSSRSSSTKSISSDGNMDLIIPHMKMHERAFVLRPCMDLMPHYIHPVLNKSLSQLWQELPHTNKQECKRVFPMGKYHDGKRRLLSMDKKAYICGILNVTPDSFSDGGRYNINVTASVDRVKEMLREGAHMIDIGGESTRPGSVEVQTDEELSRIIPVIKAIRAEGIDCIISVDTRRATVAEAAVAAGVDVINDVSGGRFDVDMIPLSLRTLTPMIYMHMRGTPQTMALKVHTQYGTISSSNSSDSIDKNKISSKKEGDNSIKTNNSVKSKSTNTAVVDIIASELKTQLEVGSTLGIPRWMQIIDPGIGFAKTADTSALLLHPQQLARLRYLLNDRLVMIGLSRKKFIEKLIQSGCDSNSNSNSSSDSNSRIGNTSSSNNKNSSSTSITPTVQASSSSPSFLPVPLVGVMVEDRDHGTIGGCLAALMSTKYHDSGSIENGDNSVNAHLKTANEVSGGNDDAFSPLLLPNVYDDVQSSVILRVHNVKAVRQATDVFTQIMWPEK